MDNATDNHNKCHWALVLHDKCNLVLHTLHPVEYSVILYSGESYIFHNSQDFGQQAPHEKDGEFYRFRPAEYYLTDY